MLVVLSGGGTAGHINPALALADELRARGCDVRFAGTPQGVEARLVAEAGIPFTPFEAAGFNRNHPLTLPKAVAKIQRSTGRAKAWLAELGADVVVGFGGYVCIPVGRAAEKLGVPVVVHEQNSVMGMANKYLAKRAAAVCLTYEHAAGALDEGARSRIAVTGNPVRKSVFDATREDGRARFGVPEDARLLLVTGGSLGARHLNQAVCALKDELLAAGDVHVVHVTGPKELDAVAGQLALTPAEEKRWHLFGYTDHMGEAMAAADAIVSRAGATSLAEISAPSRRCSFRSHSPRRTTRPRTRAPTWRRAARTCWRTPTWRGRSSRGSCARSWTTRPCGSAWPLRRARRRRPTRPPNWQWL